MKRVRCAPSEVVEEKSCTRSLSSYKQRLESFCRVEKSDHDSIGLSSLDLRSYSKRPLLLCRCVTQTPGNCLEG